MRDRPLLWSAAAFAAGILLPLHDISPIGWAACAVVAMTGGLALAAAAGTPAGLAAAGRIIALGFACAGRLAAAACDARAPFDIAALIRLHEASFAEGTELAGRLSAPARRTGDSQIEILVDLETVTLGRMPHPVRGRVRLRAAPPAAGEPPPAGWARGDRIAVFARLSAPRRYGNPGAFDYARYLRSRGIEAIGYIKSARMIRGIAPASATGIGRIRRWIDRLRSELLARIDRSFGSDAGGRRAAAVASALLLGEREGLSLEDETILQEAGLSHLLAVSGFNVAVLAVALLLAGRGLGLSARGVCLSVIPVLCLYLLLNSEEPSVERAVVMAVAALAARSLWRRPDPLNVTGLSALWILAASPLQAFDAGFQLTYAATLSLIVLSPRFMGIGRPSGGILRRAARWVKGAAVVSGAAWAGTWPLVALDFNRVTPGSLPVNLIAGPIMAAAFLCVLAIEAVFPLAAAVPIALAKAVRILVDTTFHCASAVGAAPVLSYRRITPNLLTVALYYAALAASLRLAAGRARRAAILATAGTALLLLLPLDTRRRPEGVRVTALDVGQGDAILVETPRGARILVDAGGLTRGEFDAGERVVGPALWGLGIARLDRLAVTHPDADHAGGAAAMVRNFRPAEVWLPEGAADWAETVSVARLRRALASGGPIVRRLAAGDSICLAGARVAVLNPDRRREASRPVNEESLVMTISWNGRSALLPGDAGRYEESPAAETLRADLLKVSHHGSASATSDRFARRLAPRVAVISCGARNRFGHPDPSVIGRLAEAGARICRTDRDGAVTIEMLGGAGGATRLGESCALGGRARAPIRIPR